MHTPHIFGADNYTPDRAAIEREEPTHEEPERDLTVATGVFRRLCAHFFSAGPQPEEVLQRVFAAAYDRRPDLLRGLSATECRLAREESPRGRRWRLRALFDGCEDDWQTRYRAAVATLREAFTLARRPSLSRVTLNEALTVNGCEPLDATETLSRVLDRLFAAGSSPRAVAQQAFALTGWLFRDLQLNMSLQSLGALFAEQRASQSWRSKKFVGGLLKRAGCRGTKAGWQKPESACEKYAAAARGNQNRRRGTRRFHVLPTLNHTTPNRTETAQNDVHTVLGPLGATATRRCPEMAA